MENNLFCKIFSHDFKTIYNTKSEPVSGDELFKILEAIDKNINDYDVEEDLQREIDLNKEEKTYVKTYCKRCGKVI